MIYPKILEEFTLSVKMYISHLTTSCVIFQTNIDFKGQALWGQGPALLLRSGSRFNIKMSSYQYRISHCGDKTVVKSSYLHNRISYTGKMTSLYWIRAQILSWASGSMTVQLSFESCTAIGQSAGGSVRSSHDDVIKWKHYLRYWPFFRGIHQSPAGFWCFLWFAPEQTVE